MDMGMMQQVLPPGVQDRKESDLCPEMFGISGHFEQGLSTGAEQEVVEDLFVHECQLGKLVRQGEDDMDISNGQKFTVASGDPLVASSALTLGAVPIPTAVKGDGTIAAARAQVAMSA